MSKPKISVRNLNVSYGSLHILKNITIDIPEKQITVIIGPSGCGKTTLLKCLNRLTDTYDGVKISGEIYIDGNSNSDSTIDVTHLRKRIGLLLQEPQPLPMSIYDNVAYGPRIHGLKNRKELDSIVERYLKTASLWDEVKDRLHDPASKLSLGQQQRLCLARSLAVEPEVLLCDEPTSALDPISAQQIEKLLLDLKRDYTIIVVTHILRQARRIADYLIFLYMGELIEHGPADIVLKAPKQPRTQAYISGEIS